ncbi:MliC family protein [Hydrogenophaga sp.]|uniref:MliC family protein n=1 Tax=Hydrogenophaga sp. TaxID=1904254 RepID=UPI00272081CA|nr:MliC family protein [Hydrogenophaga sp.]MDO9436254.1 MliC family protein [Hydrogenophaga sp.]
MLIRTLLAGLCAALGFTAYAQGSKPVPASPAAAQPSLIFSSQTVRYRCDGDAEIELAYLNLSNGTTFAALHYKDRTLMLQGRKATTGVRFFALEEKATLSWYTQGMKGELSAIAADPNVQDQILMSNCFAQPAKR